VINELVQQWLWKAELTAVGFYCQQAAEKFLRTFLVEHQIESPKTHVINELLALIAPHTAAAGRILGDR